MPLTDSCSELLVPSSQHFFWLVEPLRGGAWLEEVGHQDGPLEVTPGLGSSLPPGLFRTVIALPPCLSLCWVFARAVKARLVWACPFSPPFLRTQEHRPLANLNTDPHQTPDLPVPWSCVSQPLETWGTIVRRLCSLIQRFRADRSNAYGCCWSKTTVLAWNAITQPYLVLSSLEQPVDNKVRKDVSIFFFKEEKNRLRFN